MGHLINVKGSQVFSKQFLTSLCSRKTVGASVIEARLAMMQDMRRATDLLSSAVEISDWFVPQFFQCAGDNTLIPSKNTQAASDTNGDLKTLFTALIGRTGLLGRVKEVQRLKRMVMSQPMVAVSGLAGVGKTSLVLHVASWFDHTSEFPDGVFYVDCQYNNDLERALLKLIQNDDSVASWTGSTANAHDFVTLLRNRRLLLILDHVAISDADSTVGLDLLRDEAASRNLLQALEQLGQIAQSSSKVVLVTRSQPGFISSEAHLPIAGLNQAAALTLLRATITSFEPQHEFQYPDDVLTPVLDYVQNHPLSVKLIAWSTTIILPH